MAQQNDNLMSDLLSKVGDIHKLLFSDVPKRDNSRLEDKFKAEILLGFNRKRKPRQL